MANNGGNITFGIDFNVNKSGLNDLKKSLQDIQKATTKDLVGDLGGKNAQEALAKVKQSASQIEQALRKAYNPTINATNISKFNQQLSKTGTNLNTVYQDFSKLGTTGQTAFAQLASNILTTNVQLKQTHSLLDSMGQTMVNTVKWGIASSIMNTFTGSIQNAYNYIKVLDSSLTDIRIVTGQSREEMDRFADSANKAAQNLGRQTKDYTNAALSFYQQGLSDDEVAARTETTLKAANITGAGVSDMADQLTAVWNGFKVNIEDTENVVSKLAAVADSSASNMSELATAMSKTASVANNMGVNVDQLTAQVSTIIATTRQAPQTVGNALKTIYARINDIKAGSDEAEISLGRYSAKMAQLGFNVLDQEGNLRDTGQVMEQIGQSWGSLTREQQIYLAQTMAGQRQMNNLLALFQNWDMYTKELNVSLEAQGTLDEKNSRYMESLAAHVNQLTAASEGLIQSFANGDSFKGFIDAGTVALNLLTNLVESIGGGGNAILALGSIATSVFGNVISKEINALITNFQNAQYNAEQLNQVIQNTKTMASIEGITDNSAVQAMIEAQTQAQKYYSVMSEAEINHQNNLIKELGLAEQQKMVWEANTNEATKYAAAITGIKDIKLFDVNEENVENLNDLDVSLDYLKDNLRDVSESFEDFRRIARTEKNLDAPYLNLVQLLVQLKSATGATTAQLQQYQNKLLNLDLSNANQIKTFITESKQFIQETASSVQNLDKVLLNNGAKLDQLSNTKIPNLRKSIEETEVAAKQAFDVQRVVNMVSAAGQLASAFNSLSNIPQIFSDKDLSNGEKLLKITLNLSASLPMLLSAINKINKATGTTSSLINVIRTRQIAADAIQKAYNADLLAEKAIMQGSARAHQLKIAAQEASAIATEKATIAQNAFNTSLLANPLTWVIAVLGAAVIAYNAYTDSLRKAAQSQADRAKSSAQTKRKILEDKKEQQEKVQQLYSAYKDLKSEYQNQETTLSQYQSAVSKILEQHGDHQGAVRALISSYEDLDAMMLQVREDAAKQVIKASQKSQQAEEENIVKQVGVSNTNLDWGSQYLQLRNKMNPLYWAFGDKGGANQLYYDTGIGTSQREADFFNSIMQTVGAEDRISKSLASSTGYFDVQSNISAIISQYDKLEEILKEYSDIQNNNIYKTFSGFLDSISQAVQKQQQAVSLEQQGQMDLIIAQESNQLKAVENQEQFNKKYDEIVDQFVLNGIAAEDAAAQATQRILSQVPQLEDYVYNKNIQNFVKEQYSNVNQKVQQYVDSLSTEDQAILFRTGFKVDKDTVVANVKTALQDAKQQINSEANGLIINLTDGISDLLVEKQGKKLSKDDKEKIEALVYAQGLTEEQRNRLFVLLDENAALSQQIQALQEIRSIRNQENFNAASNAYSEAGESLDLEQEALHQRVTLLEDRIREYKETIAQAFERGQTDVILQTEELIHNTQNEIDNLQRQIEDFDWTIHIDVDQVESGILSGFRGEVQNLTEDSYLLAQAATMIGEGYKVAASDIATLTSIFPEITQNAQVTGEGILQLDEEIVKQVLNGNTAVLESNAEVTKDKLQGQVNILEAEIAYCDQRLEILDRVLAGEISQADAAKEITEAKATFEESMANAAGKSWVDAQTQATQKNAVSTNTVIQNLQKLGMTANAVSEAVAKALAGQVANYSSSGLRASGASGGGFEQSSNVSNFATKNGLGLDQAAARVKQLQAERAAIQEERDNAQKLKNEYLDLMAKTTEKTTEAISKAGYASQGLGGGYTPPKETSSKKSGGGGGKKGSGSSAKDKTKSADQIEKKKLKDDQIDRYHELDRAIKDVQETIDDLNRAEGKTVRNGLSQTIDQQVAALEQQKGLYEQKLGLMQADLQMMQANLSALGVQFDEQGNIINYTALMIEYQSVYNQLLEEAKLLTGEQQQAKLAQAEAKKAQLDALKSQMGAYEQLQDKIVDAGNAIQDILDKEEELRIKQFKIKIDTELDKAQAERDWNEFRKKVIDQIKKDDYLGQARARLQDFYSYYKPDGGGIIQELTEHVNRTRQEAEIIENGGVSSIYGENEAQALEDLKHYNEQLMQSLEDVEDLIQEIQDLYLDTIDKAKDAFDEQIDTYEQIDSIIQHDLNLIQMLDPTNNEEQLARYYQMRAENNNKELDFYRRQKEMWKELMDSAEQGSEDWKKFRDNWMESVSSLNDAVEAAVENLLDKYQNTIQQIIRSTKDEILGGDWKKALDEWDRAKWLDDRYLDIGTRATGVLDFVSDVNKAIEGAPLKQQQELLKFMNAEVDRLNNMTRLRQVDLDISNKKLEVLQKQMALEDAQESKTRLRLRRDSQGNYTYQYVADEDQIATREQELRDTLEELRQLAKVDVSDTIDAVEEKLTEFFDRAQELSQTYYNDEEALRQKLLELQEQYFGEEGYLTLLGIDYNEMQGELLEATGAQFTALYAQQKEELKKFLGLDDGSENSESVWGSIITLIGADEGKIPTLLDTFTTSVIPDNFKKISDENKKLLFEEGGLNPSWDTALGNVGIALGNTGNEYQTFGRKVRDITKDIIVPAIKNIVDATDVYKTDLGYLQIAAGQSFGTIKTGLDVDLVATQALTRDNGALVETYKNEVTAAQAVVAQLGNLVQKYGAARDAAIEAAAAAHQFWMQALGRTIDGSATSFTPNSGTVSTPSSTPTKVTSGTSTGGSSGRGSGKTVSYSTTIQKPKVTSGTSLGGATTKPTNVNLMHAFATGGYTGEWINGDEEGRVALLHQKELVLNAEDTKNILSAVDLVRGIMRSVSGLNMAMQDGLPSTGRFSSLTNNNNGMNQSVIINADFPAVSDAQEIKQAFNNLINIASQKASGNRRTY